MATFYNLLDATADVRNNPDLTVSGFFLSEMDVIDFNNPIPSSANFQNSIPNQIIYARVENPFECIDIAEMELQISNNLLNIPSIETCDFVELDGFITFDLDEVNMAIANQIPPNTDVSYYENDAFTGNNQLDLNYSSTMQMHKQFLLKYKATGIVMLYQRST
ncbi:hypothetical protein [Winogradskyella sp.]|uniref:hypothetical protein n=1 Tax=Winogradskyella sp. TaxID=1883156 RepID=UPI0025D07866|nr:hypothetical protein [Winogradskyella sp.]